MCSLTQPNCILRVEPNPTQTAQPICILRIIIDPKIYSVLYNIASSDICAQKKLSWTKQERLKYEMGCGLENPNQPKPTQPKLLPTLPDSVKSRNNRHVPLTSR